nr:MAG: internal scaffolding protein [Microvirus sp.]
MKNTDRKHSIRFNEPSMTKQSFTAECDINNIMKKAQKTGVISHLNKYEAHYLDTDSITFHESMNIVANANSMFAELPSKTRTFFENDPAKFMDFVHNPDNQDKLYSMGLADTPLDKPETLNPAPLTPAPAAAEVKTDT